MTRPRFAIYGTAVLRADGAEIIAGPAEQIAEFLRKLEADPPPPGKVAERVRAMIGETEGCSFAPAGIMLRREGLL